MDTEFNLERFVEAQAPVYSTVIKELKSGRKASHWMWFIFPQLAGLGRSATAREFAIASADEAAAYLAHPLLGARLRECSALVLAIDDKQVDEIFAPPDDLKFHSSMTLFAEIAPDEAVFQDCINKFFDGELDEATVDRL
jgi:uncharacterized protein (DUF1810 family)